MQLQEMFAKPIDRDIKGVIKVGQSDDENVKQELEEYVVTRELSKHFRDFFEAYAKGITGNTDKMGVWISGFFGSGKSHFLKILSYLIDGNREVAGKKPIDYFVEDNKISDPVVLANMKLAAQTSSNVILFNIDSKGDMSGKSDKDAIVSVFLKVFNEMQGFCGDMPFLADLERKLTENGRYEEFESMFLNSFGTEWREARSDFDFIQDDIVEVLSEMDFMSEEAARNWCERSVEPYAISIENFSKMVKKYIDKKGNNHHIIFLVDEIGQYIGTDSKLMLNLQTVTEDLGTACQGKAWVIVTSQQDIDSVAKEMSRDDSGTQKNDFSKIQGRFDTRLSLSSANVDEVIRQRILKKKDVPNQTLELLYEQKATIIKNLILFNDSVEKKLYAGELDFAEVYPFVPYQFHLLGSVLTAIRTHGASGKHLAEGERSMLALFKESAMQIKGKEQGVLVPFNMFYDALEQFLEHSHRGVIIHALESDILNPNKDEQCFAVNVLKTLFMIKNVKEIEANIENITSLMVSNIDEDRLELQKKVEKALKDLESQTLIQRNGTVYIFLTDEEQEVNQEIEKQNVEIAEVIGRLAETIFSDIYASSSYRHNSFGGRYTFGFNQILDDRPYKSNQRYDITLRILTPNAEIGTDETILRMKSAQESSVIVALPNDRSYIDELRLALKIEKYLTRNTENSTDKREQIKAVKRLEAKERRKNSELFLKEAMKSSVIYVNGDVLQSSAKDFSSRINDAMGKLVATVYHKLSYIDGAMGEMDIRKMLQKTSQLQLEEDKEIGTNKLALNDAIEYIGMNSVNHAKTSLRTMFDRFTKAPYGFIDDDVRWIVARLFKNGDVAMYVNSESISLIDKSCEDIVRYLTKRDFVDKLLLDKRERANEKQKKAVRDIMKELFGISVSADDDDALMSNFMRKINGLKGELEKIEIRLDNQNAYPGKMVFRAGKSLVASVIGIKSTTEFFAEICDKKDDLLDFAEDYEPLKTFFAGEQVTIFDRTLEKMKIYEESKTFIVNDDLEKVVEDIYAIIKKSAPYSEIFRLPELLDQYIDAYSEMLNQMAGPIREAVAESKQRVYDELTGKGCETQLKENFNKRWFELSEKIECCNNVATLQNIKVEADALKNRMLNEIAVAENSILERGEREKRAKAQEDREKHEPERDDPGMLHEEPPTYQAELEQQPKQKKRKYISIRNVAVENSWQLENEGDIDKYLGKLREKLVKTLEDDTVIHIEL